MDAPDRITTYAMAIAHLVTDDDGPEKLRSQKFSAIQQVAALTNHYAKEGIRKDLVDTIMEKKIALILKAKTGVEVEKAAKPPQPRYTGAAWIEDPFTVPEEELVIWSCASLRAPLTGPGYERYSSLFEQVFGRKPHSLSA